MWQDLELSQFEFAKKPYNTFQNSVTSVSEAGAKQSKKQGTATTGPHHSHRLLYFVQRSMAEGDTPPALLPAAHTLMCMLRSIKLA